jgi:arylformamidase
MPVWPGDPAPVLAEQRNGSVLVTSLSIGLHTGTHLDAPRHFLPDGQSIAAYPLERFIGKARVCTIHGITSISREELQAIDLAGVERVLFRTSNSSLWHKDSFQEGFIGLEADAARYLVTCGVELVGIDYLSIQAYGEDNDVHTILLENDLLILEGLNLGAVADGDYLLCCLPLSLPGVEASPVRAVLLPLNEQGGCTP